ncbi:MAG TPA: sigma 54-interacting transcriptional regulator [Syntrophales bacterium]|nr:sigma 54-interacting transcriptional regulator [Syntrophales bacterium]HOM08240.1 sigma 54-interacting transcriptional regulator [Syntrophales bacterium]HPQ06641.1 sigma 54-interacting transcriptional regulator [Syntrophales bacterium]
MLATDTEKILDSVAVGVFSVDRDMNIRFFNAQAEAITGFSKGEALGRKCYEIFRTDHCLHRCFLRMAIAEKSRIMKVRNVILSKKNREIPVEITVAVLMDGDGNVVGGVESFLDDSVRVSLEKEIHDSWRFDDIVGRDAQIRKVFDVLKIVAPTDSHILLQGETGTGKDLVARAIHNASRRRGGPFIKVNCAALPPQLLESELFGYRKGAFTDARTNKPGRFQMAAGGTIFLDEIGEMPLELQAKLLQVLDEKQFYPLGSIYPVSVDVRVITSTNRRLRKMTHDRKFRADLYYRLSVVEIEIPPLRERTTDIPLLIAHFLDEHARRNGKARPEVSMEFMKILLDYGYPGNVRELKNILEHAVILAGNQRLDVHHLPAYLMNPPDRYGVVDAPEPAADEAGERNSLRAALQAHGWNRAETARALRVNRTTLWRRMKKHGLLPGAPA